MTERAKKLLLLYYKQSRKIRRVSGLPPLTFKAKKAGTLKNYRIYGNTETKTRSYSGSAPLSFPITNGTVSNYRIYGNTVNGESVGDRTENLFDKNSTGTPGILDEEGNLSTSYSWIVTPYIAVSGEYVIISGVSGVIPAICAYDSNKQFVRGKKYNGASQTTINVSDCAFIRASIPNAQLSTAMINYGSTALPYEPYGYKIPITNNSETANIYLDTPLRKVGNEAEYVDYTTQKQHKVRKNLLKNTARSQTINGVTFTVNNDGSVTCNGTASVTTYLDLNENFNSTLYAGMKASFYQSGQQPSINTFRIRISKANRVTLQDFVMNDQVITDNGDSLLLAIRIQSGYTCDNLTFYPMIRKADITDGTYEPYIENTEVDVTIPDLPAQSSTNSLSIGTSVQPSSIAVDVSEIVSCGDKVTDSQSVNYGKYKIPVTLTAGSTETTNIFLDAPLAKSGNNDDYIDYAEQKRYNADGTESNVTLPATSTLAGTNTLTVGTEVQPSSVEIKGRIKAAGGD